MSQTYSIRDLADEFDITTRTIRFYEAEGMLQPRREGQTRIYSPQDRVTLKLILRGKRLGLSLAQSRELIEMYAPGETPDASRSWKSCWRRLKTVVRICGSSYMISSA